MNWHLRHVTYWRCRLLLRLLAIGLRRRYAIPALRGYNRTAA